MPPENDTKTDGLPVNLLTVKELRGIAAKRDIAVPSSARSKDAILGVLRDAKVPASVMREALVEHGHLEAEPAPPATPPTPAASNGDIDGDGNIAGEGTVPTATAKPTDNVEAGDLEDVDLDELESDGDIEATLPSAQVPKIEAKHLPKLKKAGAAIRRVQKRSAPQGDNPGTWWCPFTDASKLVENEAPDVMPQSRAHRVSVEKDGAIVDYAVVLPPQGIPAGILD